MKAAPRTICLLHPSDHDCERETTLGATRYAQSRTNWRLITRYFSVVEGVFEDVHGDGIIVCLGSPETEQRIRDLRLPTVSIFGPSGFPNVGLDEQQIGLAAAEHFIARGFFHFAYVGKGDSVWDLPRQQGYIRRLEELGFTCPCLDLAGVPQIDHEHSGHLQAVGRFLAHLPKPLAVFGGNDILALEVINACKLHRQAVPGNVAVLGVDNIWRCELIKPQLSSIVRPVEAMAFKAAEMLDAMLDRRIPISASAGEPWPPKLLLPPLQTILRASTDTYASPDRDIVRAIEYMRKNLGQLSGVGEIADHVAMSRRTLEHRFEKALGRGPGEELRRQQIEKARELLGTTRLTVEEIGRLCGFAASASFVAAFHRIERITPGAYRRSLGT